jgi:branched-chain amino acid transport system ATP-binding protein
MAPLLSVEDLVVAYDHLVAVDGIDIGVPAGSVVALLGPNGAGKSTLLKAIAGLVPARSGSVRLDGTDLGPLSAHERSDRGVCLIPEGRGIFPALTVSDNLRVALGNDPAGIARVLEFFPVLGQRQQQLAGTLSGGEQQMLALARAVGAAPVLLMADELSLGLAPLLVRTLNEALRRLHEEEGRTILLVEQYATHALELADFVVILSRGQVAWAGEPVELRASKVLVDTYLGSTA